MIEAKIRIEEKIKSVIRDVKDFPKPGIVFKDITPILLDAALSKDIADELAERVRAMEIDAVLAIESRGFLFGMMLAERLKIPFIPVRKKGKLPSDTVSYSYDLEYGSAVIEIHKGDIKKGDKVLIHDDLLATGGTTAATAELVKSQEAEIAGFAFMVELDFLKGKEKLTSYTDNILSLVHY